MKEMEVRTVVVGTGAAGYAAAVRLSQYGEKNLVILSENINAGTSRNTGSDKQTYYKLSLAGKDADSISSLSEDLFKGGCVDGDMALCEAALSAKCFYYLTELGVPFPESDYGEMIGYKTDHDKGRRASSVGPYTSKMMTECLEREAVSRGISVLDKMQMIKILVKDNEVKGILCLDKNSKTSCEYLIIWCNNLVLATGGPAAMYRDSVYPASQIGSSGIAFEAGIKGKNLTEWQFGMASLKPRWNVSGTYMQALPRFVSTDKQGGDEKEFLLDYFEDAGSMQSLIFLKGYQWPFDVNKIYGGSSVIDLLVYQETILKGRRVFLDFRRNPGGEAVAFDNLSKEAFLYLDGAGACLATPIERLRHMNEPAVSFYREHGVDLQEEMLEIAICAQHNNGGLSTDCNWQTNVKGIYAVGEVCGSHGVARPGGSALNAGQAGAVRAAEHIVYVRNRELQKRKNENAVRNFCRDIAEKYVSLFKVSENGCNIAEIWKKAALRMSKYGGMIRSKEGLATALSEVEEILKDFDQGLYAEGYGQAGMYFHLYDMLISQKVYISAMIDYVSKGGDSRGSALYTNYQGQKPMKKMPDLFSCVLDKGRHGDVIQEICLVADNCYVEWRPIRPLPETDYVFETQWKALRRRRSD